MFVLLDKRYKETFVLLDKPLQGDVSEDISEDQSEFLGRRQGV